VRRPSAPGSGRGAGRQEGGPRDLRQAEVQHLHRRSLAVPSAQQDVAGLEVAVEDALLVGRVDGGGDGVEDRQRPLERQGARRPAELREGHAVQQLHHQVGGARSGVDPEVGDVHDVGMAEPPERLGLPLEAAHRERIAGLAGLQELEREDPLEPQMGGAIDDAGSPFPEAIVQTVLPVENGRKATDAERHEPGSVSSLLLCPKVENITGPGAIRPGGAALYAEELSAIFAKSRPRSAFSTARPTARSRASRSSARWTGKPRISSTASWRSDRSRPMAPR
jgi:hypothetical protein